MCVCVCVCACVCARARACEGESLEVPLSTLHQLYDRLGERKNTKESSVNAGRAGPIRVMDVLDSSHPESKERERETERVCVAAPAEKQR